MKKLYWLLLIPVVLYFLSKRKVAAPAGSNGNPGTADPSYQPVSNLFRLIKTPTPGEKADPIPAYIAAGSGFLNSASNVFKNIFQTNRVNTPVLSPSGSGNNFGVAGVDYAGPDTTPDANFWDETTWDVPNDLYVNSNTSEG